MMKKIYFLTITSALLAVILSLPKITERILAADKKNEFANTIAETYSVKGPAFLNMYSQIIGYAREESLPEDIKTSKGITTVSFELVGEGPASDNNYEDVLKLEHIIEQTQQQSVERKETLKKIGDTYFDLGKRITHHHYFKAVKLYKRLLKEYPDPQNGNDSVYQNLALSYEGLNFFHEAIATWEKLISSYSSSPLKRSAFFHLAKDLYRVGRYEKAVEAYRNFLNFKEKSGEEKNAWLGLAASYFKLNNYQHAHEGYETVASKWPPFTDVPKEHLFQAGVSAYMCSNHHVALHRFSAFSSLYPYDPLTPKALLMSARSLLALNKTKSALHILSLILERYPQSEEARESIHMVALLGIREREKKIPFHLAAAPYFYDPILSYDILLNTSPKPPKEREDTLLLEKAEGLQKMGYGVESLKTYLSLLDRKPEESIKAETLVKAGKLSSELIDRCYAEGDTLGVLYIYYLSSSRGVFRTEHLHTLIKVAQIMEKSALFSECQKLLNFIKITSTDKKVINEAEEIHSRAGKREKTSPLNLVVAYLEKEATPDVNEITKAINNADEESKRWLLYALVRKLLKENDVKKTAEVTAQIKEGTTQTFWVKLADYTLETMNRIKKYPDLYWR